MRGKREVEEREEATIRRGEKIEKRGKEGGTYQKGAYYEGKDVSRLLEAENHKN